MLGFGGCTTQKTTESRVYYVDALSGDDLNSGTSPEKPWRTLSRINANALHAGDRVLLKGGQVFHGSLRLTKVAGTAQAPVRIASYGSGRAVIESGDSVALRVDSSRYVQCSNIILRGSGRLSGNKTDGLLFSQVENASIDSMEASGFLYSGIHISGGSDITITRVYAHDNGFCGILAESGAKEYGADGSAFKTLKRVYIGNSVAENNPGCPAITDNHSGNGILLGGVVNGMVEYCEAMNNGWDMPREGNGPVGIWAYMSDSVVIQHCYAHHNKTSPRGKDGGGFDFDGGMRYSILQYNLSAFNEGAGYGIFQYAGATAWSDNIARYNVSYQDGSKNSQAGIFMWCDPIAQPMQNFHAYNNTIVSRYGLGVNFEPGAYANFLFENNIFLITGKTDRFVDGKYSLAVFDRNLYWLSDGSGRHQQPAVTVDAHGVLKDPGMILPAGQEPWTVRTETLTQLPWFGLAQDSPAREAGNIIPGHGGFDFWKHPVPNDQHPHLGAWQGN